MTAPPARTFAVTRSNTKSGPEYGGRETSLPPLKLNVVALLFNGALKDKARSVYMGVIQVHKHAQKTDAYQRNGNLILDSTARADSIPGLEIEADDVRCTHGATAAQVEEEYVFYLMARGLSRARALLGSVSNELLHIADRPVVVIPAAATTEAEPADR